MKESEGQSDRKICSAAECWRLQIELAESASGRLQVEIEETRNEIEEKIEQLIRQGELLTAKGKREQGIQAFEEAIILGSNDAHACKGVALLFTNFEKNFFEGIEELAKACLATMELKYLYPLKEFLLAGIHHLMFREMDASSVSDERVVDRDVIKKELEEYLSPTDNPGEARQIKKIRAAGLLVVLEKFFEQLQTSK